MLECPSAPPKTINGTSPTITAGADGSADIDTTGATGDVT